MHLIHCNPAGEKTHICLVSKRSGLFPAGDTSQGIRCTTHQQKVHIGYIEHSHSNCYIQKLLFIIMELY